MRWIVENLVKLILHVFFFRVEVAGEEKGRTEGPVLFVMNHPNALIDPVLLQSFCPRDVSFLAKSTLFTMPVIRWFVQGLEAIPVYRRQDVGAGGGSKNKEMFTTVWEQLAAGRAVAVFPEGVSHDAPHLMELKTGAARIAMGAALRSPDTPVRIVPAGLYYMDKVTFRSSALVYFGDPITVPTEGASPEDPGHREAVVALTEEIRQGLSEVTLQAEHQEALRLVERAEEIFTADVEDEVPLEERFELRQQFMEGYSVLRQTCPDEIARLELRVTRYERDVTRLDLDHEHLTADRVKVPTMLRYVARQLGLLTLLAPLGFVGMVVHFPAYHLIDFLAWRLSRDEDDVVSTIKVLGGMLFFPLSWIVVAVCSAWAWGWEAGLAALVVIPLTGLAGMWFMEAAGELGESARGWALSFTRRKLFARLCEERRIIRESILKLAQRLEEGGDGADPIAPEA
jgi:glycerol-3-phosphate O-acyltransferase / dihydroxyacetone phosphate acyltransferase